MDPSMARDIWPMSKATQETFRFYLLTVFNEMPEHTFKNTPPQLYIGLSSTWWHHAWLMVIAHEGVGPGGLFSPCPDPFSQWWCRLQSGAL